MSFRVLVVDDEPLAREGVIRLLNEEKDFQLVGEARDGHDAVSAINDMEPDLVFLDVQMPGLDGFGVVEAMGDDMPGVIFVTAYDEFALKAFDIHAVDYLLKPIERERFASALDEARSRLRNGETPGESERLEPLLDDVHRQRNNFNRILVKDRGNVRVVRTDELLWIAAAGNYARLYVGDEQLLMRQTMTTLEKRLDPDRFVRIHRSTIVNVDHITEIRARDNGEYVVVMDQGKKLTLSRRYRDVLEGRLRG